LNAIEKEVFAAAVDLYACRLLNDEHALAYLARSGFPRNVVERYRLGYAFCDKLVSYLRWRELPVGAARRISLLKKNGRESIAGRITMPELRGGRPVWLIGRVLRATSGDNAFGGPRYLGLPGRKPLLGWEEAGCDRRGVYLVEKPLDLLTLRMWGVPRLALAGSAPSFANLSLLKSFDRIYLALDRDAGGTEATEPLKDELGSRAVRIELPPGVKDVAHRVCQWRRDVPHAYSARRSRFLEVQPVSRRKPFLLGDHPVLVVGDLSKQATPPQAWALLLERGAHALDAVRTVEHHPASSGRAGNDRRGW
jgi:DNA primase